MDYSVCNTENLKAHLCSVLPQGSMSAFYNGVYWEEADSEELFRSSIDTFVHECNLARTAPEWYEVCEDRDPATHVITFYVMREDGEAVAELSVLFLDKDADAISCLHLVQGVPSV